MTTVDGVGTLHWTRWLEFGGATPARPRAVLGLFLALMTSASSFAQSPSGPVPGLLSELVKQRLEPRQSADRAKVTALSALRSVGGRPAEQAEKLQLLKPQLVLEQMAVFPVIGPSTIAPPIQGASPTPSVNDSSGEGATTAHPGVALLLARYAGENDFTTKCTGTLIRQNVVLTAAHCMCYSRDVTKNYKSGLECSNGTTDKAPSPLMSGDNWRVFFQHVGMRQVKNVIVHEGYRFDSQAVRDDLALLVLDRPVREIDSPLLPAASNPASPWSTGRVVGFGYNSVDRPGATVLAQLVRPGLKGQGEVKASSCEKQSYLDPARSLCSVFDPDATGSASTVCGGDSGGPLWKYDETGLTIGVTSGRSEENCAKQKTVAFQMATSYQPHRSWIDQHLQRVAIAETKGKWPPFGDNLLYVVDKRNVALFDEKGAYKSIGWMRFDAATSIVATINSPSSIDSFYVQDRFGKILCRGEAGARRNVPNADFCRANVPAKTQFRIVAKGLPDEYLQYVVSTTAPLQTP